MASHSTTPVAKAVPFDKTNTQFASDDVQAAIEESYKIISKYSKENTGFAYGYGEYAYQKSTMVFSDATRTLSLSPVSGQPAFVFLMNKEVYVRTGTDTVTIDDIEGLWFIFYRLGVSGIELTATQTPWSFNDNVFVALLYWDSTNKKSIIFAEERHGLVMDWRTHEYLHRTEGTRVENGGLVVANFTVTGNGSMNSHATYSVSNGVVFDEDIVANVSHSASPSLPFEQYLSPLARMPVFYRIGASNWWRRKEPTDYAFYENAGTTASYNQNIAGTWQLTNVTSGWYFATWLIYTTDIKYPVASILGQRQDDNLIDAVNNNTRASLMLEGLPQQEKFFARKLIWQTHTGYTNTPKTRLVYVSEAREIPPSNDRYALIASYNGNANSGRYLEFFPGQSSDVNPFPIPDPSFIRTVTVSTSAASTGVIAFYKNFDFNTPILQVPLTNNTYTKYTTTILINTDDRISCKVISGSLSKPNIVVFIQTSV